MATPGSESEIGRPIFALYRAPSVHHGADAAPRRQGYGRRRDVQEFKTFVSRGNVIDLAVAVIIGAAFQRIVSSLTDDPDAADRQDLRQLDFSSYFIALGPIPANLAGSTDYAALKRPACRCSAMARSSPRRSTS